MRFSAIAAGAALVLVTIAAARALMHRRKRTLAPLQSLATASCARLRLLFIGDPDLDFNTLFMVLNTALAPATQFCTANDMKQIHALHSNFLRRMTALKQQLNAFQSQNAGAHEQAFIEMLRLRQKVLVSIDRFCDAAEIPRSNTHMKCVRAAVYYFFHVHVYMCMLPTFATAHVK